MQIEARLDYSLSNSESDVSEKLIAFRITIRYRWKKGVVLLPPTIPDSTQRDVTSGGMTRLPSHFIGNKKAFSSKFSLHYLVWSYYRPYILSEEECKLFRKIS